MCHCALSRSYRGRAENIGKENIERKERETQKVSLSVTIKEDTFKSRVVILFLEVMSFDIIIMNNVVGSPQLCFTSYSITSRLNAAKHTRYLYLHFTSEQPEVNDRFERGRKMVGVGKKKIGRTRHFFGRHHRKLDPVVELNRT